MSGFGVSPFGTSPFSVGTPTTTAGRTGTVLADALGAGQGSRALDPLTRRWTFNATTGRTVGMTNAQQLVLTHLLNAKDSTAWVGGGLARDNGVIGDDFPTRRRAAITTALAPLVAAKVIEVTDIVVDTTVRPVLERVLWRDVTADTAEGTTLP